jgi:hypothetical protein
VEKRHAFGHIDGHLKPHRRWKVPSSVIQNLYNPRARNQFLSKTCCMAVGPRSRRHLTEGPKAAKLRDDPNGLGREGAAVDLEDARVPQKAHDPRLAHDLLDDLPPRNRWVPRARRLMVRALGLAGGGGAVGPRPVGPARGSVLGRERVGKNEFLHRDAARQPGRRP